MKPSFFNRENARTQYIILDTRKCTACWKCLDACPNQVIGRVNLKWHRHALIKDHDACTGCMSCADMCESEAFSARVAENKEEEILRKKTLNRFLINNLLVLLGSITILSGLTLQLGFHMGGHGAHLGSHEIQSNAATYEQAREIDPYKTVLGFNYSEWSTIHKASIVIFSLLMIYHFYIHWNWYKGVFKKNLVKRNAQVIILSVLFILVAITGIVPWLTDLSGNYSILRYVFIEIHDKLTLVLIILLVLHVIRRTRWFASTFAKLTRGT